MPMEGNGDRRYVVILSGAMARLLRHLHRQSSKKGKGGSVTKAFRRIIRRLELDPNNAGEPAYRLPVLRMNVLRIAIRPLVVDFAVCEDRPLVFIKRIKLLSVEK